MIILITGASHTGKTLLAQRMLEQYKYPYLSIDHLKMGLIRSGNTELTPLSDDKALTAYLWPIVREMIKTAIENDQYLIVEGCYIPFYWRRDFDDRYLSSIRFICLAMTDEYIKSHFDVIIRHESDIESRLIESDITIDRLIAENHRMIEGFQSTGEQVILISSDYEQNITELLAYGIWHMAYENGWFVRLSIVDKATASVIGTVECCLRVSDDAFDHMGILRIDVRSDYEEEKVLYELFSLITPELYELLGCKGVLTKAPIFAVERIKAIRKAGFTKSEHMLIGKAGFAYDGYWTIK